MSAPAQRLANKLHRIAFELEHDASRMGGALEREAWRIATALHTLAGDLNAHGAAMTPTRRERMRGLYHAKDYPL